MAWSIIGVAAAVELLAGAVWVGVGIGHLATGRAWQNRPYRLGVGPVRTLFDPATTSTVKVIAVVVFVLALAAVTVAAVYVAGRVRGWQAARAKLAPARAVNARADVTGMTPADRAEETKRLHPTMPTVAAVMVDGVAAAAARDVLGIVIPRGPEVLPGWEDNETALMAPRSGKTTTRAIPKLAAAPGLAIGTANKGDLYQATWKIRARRGTVWNFDPQGITRAAASFWWDPLEVVVDDETAGRLAAQFGRGAAASGDFWDDSAEELLTGLLLAAATSPGKSLRHVWRWLNRTTDDEAARLLDDAGFPQVAIGLRGMQNGATETREGIFQTARTGARCLRSENILRWVTPTQADLSPDPLVKRRPQLRLAQLIADATDTVYLLSKDGNGSAAPLLAAFLDQLFELCVYAAEDNGGRLAIPVTAVIDEAANIAPWDRLPRIASYSGSIGFVFQAILQNYEQAERVWGKGGVAELFAASTIKLVGAGAESFEFVRNLSAFVGQHEIVTRSTSHSSTGRSDSYSTQWREILPVDEIRALPKGTGLLLTTGRRPVMLRLLPWYDAPYAAQVQDSIDTARDALRLLQEPARPA